MKTTYHFKKLAFAAGIAGLLGVAGVALAQDGPENPTEIWDIARGGQLYDNWMAVLEQDAPDGNHKLYPANGKKSGATTWRCKECHGWDYQGKDGAYSGGSHFTGIIGVAGAASKSEDEIAAIIAGAEHGYGEMMSASAIQKLAKFIKSGLIDTSKYVNSDKTVNGDPSKGAAIYQTVCAVCHGFKGTDYNFGSDEKPEYVGTVAADNPWEAFHKIRFGQPGVPMIAMTALETQEMVDILAYIQTLPTK